MAQATPNPGEQDPKTQTGTRSHKTMGEPLQTPEQRLEEKHQNDAGADEKRAGQHRTDYEPPKEGERDDPNKRHKQGAQADEANARNQARDDLDNEERQKGQRAEGRAKTARAKQHMKTAKPKAKARKHK